MPHDFVLVAGPFVRASSWAPTARCLMEQGHAVQIPDVLADQLQPPAWRDWTAHLLRHIKPSSSSVLVGHSSAGPLVAELATKMACQSVVIVDGHVPPSQGNVPPVRPALQEFIAQMEAPDGLLPIWPRWFLNDPARCAIIGLDRLAGDPVAFAEFEQELFRFPSRWVKDEIDLAEWERIPVGFIRTCELYDSAVAKAESRGWHVDMLRGTHLHPVLEPQETANALVAMADRLLANEAAALDSL